MNEPTIIHDRLVNILLPKARQFYSSKLCLLVPAIFSASLLIIDRLNVFSLREHNNYAVAPNFPDRQKGDECLVYLVDR